MNSRFIATSLALLFSTAALFVPTADSSADPILKPRKYHGPIPKRAFTLSIGFLAGPNNEEMFDFLDRHIDQPLRNDLSTDDFGPALAIDGAYMTKLHPRFAVRLRTGVAFLRSTSTGLTTATEVDTSGQALLLKFEREFDVVLMSLAGSALFFFQDASVEEFQTYIGGGFSLYLPWAKYEESLANTADGQPYGNTEESEFSAEPGIHGVLGALYHIRNDLALHLEGRFEIAQSKFALDLPTDGAGVQKLNFDVDYTGFLLTAGVSKFF